MFQLGTQYENWEFNLKAIPPYEILEGELTLDIYEYFGEPIFLFQYPISKALLYFNVDILHKVIYEVDMKFGNQVIKRLKDTKNQFRLKENKIYIEIIKET